MRRQTGKLATALLFVLGACGIALGCRMLLGELDSVRDLDRVADAVRGPDGETNPQAMADRLPSGTAWLQVPGADIDLPLVQADPAQPDFYLRHTLDGSYSPAGTPYIDARTSMGSQHILAYGHHLTGIGGMFSNLQKCYRQDEFKRRCSQGLFLTTPTPETTRRHMEALCAMTVDKSYSPIQRFAWRDDEDFRSWLTTLANESTARSPDWEDLINGATHATTLVTCSSDIGGQRARTLVVFVS